MQPPIKVCLDKMVKMAFTAGMSSQVEVDCGLFLTRGAKAKIARALGITKQAVSQWRRVPAGRVLIVSEITGIPPHELRPDIYPEPDDEVAA